MEVVEGGVRYQPAGTSPGIIVSSWRMGGAMGAVMGTAEESCCKAAFALWESVRAVGGEESCDAILFAKIS